LAISSKLHNILGNEVDQSHWKLDKFDV